MDLDIPKNCDKIVRRQWTENYILRETQYASACQSEHEAERGEKASVLSLSGALGMTLKEDEERSTERKAAQEDFGRRKEDPKMKYNWEQISAASQLSLGPAQAILLVCN